MRTSDFDYDLPPERIAQTPVEPRDSSRLMVLHKASGIIEHRHFSDILEYLEEGDALVFNDSRVIPARLRGTRAGSGGKVEMLLLRRREAGVWEALVRPGRRLLPGAQIDIPAGMDTVRAEVTGMGEGGARVLRFSDEAPLARAGEVPLPPYIREPLADPERYQTIYARPPGSAAAPTAGLHFTDGLMAKLKSKGVRCAFVTLHVGLDTFRPVKEEDPADHAIYREYGVVGREAADEMQRAKREGRRVFCVGSTSVRLVEQAAQSGGPAAFEGWVELYILPGYRFRAVDAMVTNFHLPRSTLLMLVTAFGGKELVDRAYLEAITENYRFYSFGDAMLVL